MAKGLRYRQKRRDADMQVKDFLKDPEVQKAMQKEINAQLAGANDRFFQDETSIILWVLHETFGFGKKRLRRYYDRYEIEWKALKEHYEMSDNDMNFVATEKLKKIGVDLEEWAKN